jgi:hypothetical protein
MSYAAVDHDDTEDRYYTQVDAGDVRLFTLDQLDAAFNAGLIHENTYVCLEGASEWLTLGEVAGLGDEEPEAAPISAVTSVPQRVGFAASPSIVPAAPYSVAPMIMPASIRPVVNDLALDDFDPDMLAMRPKRRAGKIVAGLAVVALGALGFVVVSSGGIKLPKLNLGGSQASAASLSMAGLKDGTPTPKVETPAPAPEAAKPEPPKAEETKPVETVNATTETKTGAKADSETKTDKKTDDRFSEEMKAALLNKDKKQVTDQKRKKAARATVAASSKRKPSKAAKGSAGFKAGGSAYDPLNGKL